jgi:hypothetical protein
LRRSDFFYVKRTFDLFDEKEPFTIAAAAHFHGERVILRATVHGVGRVVVDLGVALAVKLPCGVEAGTEVPGVAFGGEAEPNAGRGGEGAIEGGVAIGEGERGGGGDHYVNSMIISGFRGRSSM